MRSLNKKVNEKRTANVDTKHKKSKAGSSDKKHFVTKSTNNFILFHFVLTN